MNEQGISHEAETLDALIDRRPYDRAGLNDSEARLAGQILDLAGAGLPVNARFYQQLEQKLLEAAEKRSRRRLLTWPVLATSLLAGSALLVLVLLGALILSRLLGLPQPGQAQPAGGPASTATATFQPAATPTPPAPAAPAGNPDELVLAAALPGQPESVPVYRQVQPGEALTAQSAQAMAARLGINGAVSSYQGESGLPAYTVSDGKSSVLFFGSTTAEFTYTTSYSAASQENKPPLPFEQQSQIAEQWLAERGLLDFPYQAQPCYTGPECVMIIQTLEGGNLYTQNPYDPLINVRINPSGKVEQVVYRPVRVEEIGRMPILSAAEVWETLQTRQVSPRIFFQTLNFTNQRSLRTWTPLFRPGERADLYGYAVIYQPVDPSQPAQIEVSGLPVSASPEMAGQIPMRQYVHVWGTYQADEQGRDWLDLQGWEVSPAEDVNLTGTLVNENGALQFKADTGELYSLPRLPASVPLGVKLLVRGAKTSTGELAWEFLQTQIEMDNNLQLGSLPVPGAPLDPAANTPPLPETGYQPGDRVRIRGELSSTIREYPDGRKELFHTLTVTPQDENGLYWSARLTGSGAGGIETYTNLPVLVEGTYGIDGNEVVITVDAYEPVWPGVHIQTWFGKIDEQVLAGQTVLILTDDSGQQWVVQSSIDFPQTLAQFGWAPGAEVAVEGYPSQEEPTQFGGLPVLVDRAMSLLDGKGLTRETYQPYLDKPQVEPAPQASLSELPGGTVNLVELVYSAQTFQGYFPSEDPPRLLLPFWRFSGTLADGRAFEILALASETTQTP